METPALGDRLELCMHGVGIMPASLNLSERFSCSLLRAGGRGPRDATSPLAKYPTEARESKLWRVEASAALQASSPGQNLRSIVVTDLRLSALWLIYLYKEPYLTSISTAQTKVTSSPDHPSVLHFLSSPIHSLPSASMLRGPEQCLIPAPAAATFHPVRYLFAKLRARI